MAETQFASSSMTLFGIREETPGARWQSLFKATWSAYRRWYLTEGMDSRPDLATCRKALSRHMPELVPTWERMVALTGDDDLAARMLSLWNPPRFAPGCAQLVLDEPQRLLIRNYDYSPTLFEQVVYSSRFTRRRVIGTGDCLWGLLDGMNDDGLLVSLTFGGRRGSGSGFGISLVVRYLLEVCATVQEARAVLRRLPVSMAYNLTISDRSGATVTAFVSPDSPVEFFDTPLATNHRGSVPEDPQLAQGLNSKGRQDALLRLAQSVPDAQRATEAFLRKPLYNTAYSRGFGTLYTAVYLPDEGVVVYHWPGTSWRRSFSSEDGTKDVILREPATVESKPLTDFGSGPMTTSPEGVDGRSVAELGELAREALTALAGRPEPEAFQTLLGLSQVAGECVGESARHLAEHDSWSRVAEVAGRTKQAAWSRWSG